MTKLIVKIKSDPKEIAISDLQPGRSAERVAKSYGITDSNLFAEVADDAFTSDEFYFRDGFDVDGGTATFALEDAKSFANLLAANAYSKPIEEAASGFTSIMLTAQSTLPAESRPPGVQIALDNVNAEILALTTVQESITAATSASKLKALVDNLPSNEE